ncbi:T9SS type A sorting domain-containing protein [Polluticoccus soli]|uniref:T9SS type A sorting domain-containing protein n=1 Tax=Polluticoccus soli TaxID=3034150 RepID=UPI0023E31561|nr:T9SS type A sorting domain-containing protein [Flavipsychrobacter sp. JY13-12]
MKKLLITVGLAAAFAPAIAQHQEHGPSYQKSVFAGHEQVGILNRESHAATREQVRQNFPGWKLTTDKITGGFSDIYGDAMVISGQSPLEKSQTVMSKLLKQLGVANTEWNLVRNAAAPKAHYVDYEQVINGHKVMFTKLSFRFTKDERLVRVNNTSFGKTIKSTSPVLSKDDVSASSNILEDVAGVSLSSVVVANDWIWFPVPAQNGYTLQPAWEFTAKGIEGEGKPVELNGFIDAITGELLYRTNEVKTISDVQVKGTVYKATYVSPATLEPIGNIEVVLGTTTVNANDTGYVSNPANSVSATVKLKGLWSTVVPQGLSTPSFSQNITGTGNVFALPDTGVNGRAVSAYYHTNRAHENAKALLPGFTGMDVSLTTNTELTSGSCNAFYSGNSINFYAPGLGGCPSFAEIGDIVYHEYGHGINRTFYADNGANSMRNGALNEGYADVWAMTIAKDSILGRGAMGSSASFIRRYDVNPKVYPTNIVGEVHADGEIIAGAWWDVARNTGSYETMTEIFTEAFHDVADGPTGMEGAIYHKILISAILSDDNDATLSNGTPHLQEIVSAFAKHGIYLYADAQLNHQELAHQPQNTPITVNASLTITNSDFFTALKLYFRNRAVGTWDSVVMTNNGGFSFTAQIPGQPQGALVDYYFSISDALTASTVNYPTGFSPLPPSNNSNIPYQFAVGVSNRIQITFEDETMDDWQIGDVPGDNATATGKWVHAKPVGTFSSPSNGAFGSFITQTDKDHTTGSGKCLVTGNGSTSNITSNDVDGGRTTVYTPVFDLTTFVNPIIEYYRWFSNDRYSGQESNRRNDEWLTYISYPGGNSQQVERTLQADHSWRRRVFAVDQFFPGQRTIQMRFVANDPTASPSVVEAAIDDFFIYDGVPTSVADVAQLKASIYPNPADENVTISLTEATKGTIAVYDLLGKQVSALQMDGAKTSYVIETSHLAAGQYMVLIQGDNKTIQSNKLVVTHK